MSVRIGVGALRSPKGEGESLSANRESDIRQDDSTLILSDVAKLTSAITLRIWPNKAQTDMLWAAARCMPHVEREVTLGLLKGEGEGVAPATYACRKAVAIAKAWGEIPAKPRKDGRLPDACWRWGGAFVGEAAMHAATRFATWKKKNLEKASPPWAKSVGFGVRTDGVRLSKNGRRVHVSLAMLGMRDGHRQAQPVFIVTVEGRQSPIVLDRILAGEYSSKSCRVVNKDGKWLLKVSYQWPKPHSTQAKGIMFVRRTTNKFLVAMTLAGESPEPLLETRSIVALKTQLDARKKAVRQGLAHRGSGARGHGVARRYREYTRLDGIERNTVATWCQQQAAWIAKESVRLNCGMVMLEDFAGSSVPVSEDRRLQTLLRRFPFAKLNECIEWACKKHGLECSSQVVHTSVECPVCGEVVSDRSGWKVCVCGLCVQKDTLAIWRIILAAKLDTVGMVKRADHEARLAKTIERSRTHGVV